MILSSSNRVPLKKCKLPDKIIFDTCGSIELIAERSPKLWKKTRQSFTIRALHLIPKPAQLRSLGYLENIQDIDQLNYFSSILEADENSLARQNLIRYIDWWQNKKSISRRMQQLVYAHCLGKFEKKKCVSFPPNAIQHLRHLANMPFLASAEDFNWMNSIEDKGNSKVLRSHLDLHACGQRLNIFAMSYAECIEYREMVLVSLIVALGVWDIVTGSWAEIQGIGYSECS